MLRMQELRLYTKLLGNIARNVYILLHSSYQKRQHISKAPSDSTDSDHINESSGFLHSNRKQIRSIRMVSTKHERYRLILVPFQLKY